MKTRIRYCGLILALMALSGCSGVLTSDQPAKQYYTLMPLAGAAGPGLAAGGHSLAISVNAVPGLDTDRIQALAVDARLIPYDNARWPDYLPEVLGSVMRRSMTASGLFPAVVNSDRVVDGGWLVYLEIQQFYGIQSAAGHTSSVLVEMGGLLECNGERRQLTLSESTPVSDEQPSNIVTAHQRGLDAVTRQLLETIAGTCSPG